ncbi:DNA methyltransferase [Lysinibacillus sp. NPDC056232]|uniref:DNA methyltransferase n=1 Tax=Lysinibacillus sp. NPDC056232 TaxID=3345756 RepID=UPI0035E1BDB2
MQGGAKKQASSVKQLTDDTFEFTFVGENKLSFFGNDVFLKNKKSKLHNSEIRNTVVKNGPKNPISEILLPEGFPCEVKQMIIPKREDAWPIYNEDLIIENYKLVNPVVAKSGWSSKKILLKFIENEFNTVLDTKKQETSFVITQTGNIDGIKGRKKDSQSHVISVLKDLGSTQSMSNKLQEQNMSFDYPKPTELLEYLISMVDGNDFIVLDFFSGSGSTAEAVLDINLRDGGKRRFILVEWDESSIRDIAVQRVRNKIAENLELKDIKYSYLKVSDPIIDKFKRIQPNLPLKQFVDYIYFLEFSESNWMLIRWI